MANFKIKVLETCGGFDPNQGPSGQHFVFTSGIHEVSAAQYELIKGDNVELLDSKTPKVEKRPAKIKSEKRG